MNSSDSKTGMENDLWVVYSDKEAGSEMYIMGNSKHDVIKKMSKNKKIRSMFSWKKGAVDPLVFSTNDPYCPLCETLTYFEHSHKENEVTEEMWLKLVDYVWRLQYDNPCSLEPVKIEK